MMPKWTAISPQCLRSLDLQDTEPYSLISGNFQATSAKARIYKTNRLSVAILPYPDII